MYQPHSIVFNSEFVCITRHEDADYMRGTPLSEKLNPLRYEIYIKPKKIAINKNARWNIALSNILYRIKKDQNHD